MGVDLIHDQLEPFGFGAASRIDVAQGEVTGVAALHRKWKRSYSKRPNQKWYAGETISLGIGQGYNSFTDAADGHGVQRHAFATEDARPPGARDVEDVVRHENSPHRQRCAATATTQTYLLLIHPDSWFWRDAGHLAWPSRARPGRRQDGHSTNRGPEDPAEVQQHPG